MSGIEIAAHHWVAMSHSFHWSTQLTTGWPCYTAFDFLNFVLEFLIKCNINIFVIYTNNIDQNNINLILMTVECRQRLQVGRTPPSPFIVKQTVYVFVLFFIFCSCRSELTLVRGYL